MSTPSEGQIDHLLSESRRFAPSAAFAAQRSRRPDSMKRHPPTGWHFWADRARELVHWHTPFTEVLDWSNPPFATWFGDGTLNVAYNCLDRHVEAGNGDRVALLWRASPATSDA